MEIIPIAGTTTDWEMFVKIIQKYLKRSPTRPLDDHGIPVGSPESYLAALGEFRQKNTDPRNIDDTVLRHISLSLLLIIPPNLYTDIIIENDQNLLFLACQDYIPKKEVAVIASGSLKAWKDCILIFNSGNDDLREFAYQLYETLRKIGFNTIFSGYKVVEDVFGDKRLEKR